MKIYTIGFTKKSAREFFGLLAPLHIDVLVDIRLNNKSQLAGWTKYPDIVYFLEKHNIGYIHDVNFSPSIEILTKFKKEKGSWDAYTTQFEELMQKREIMNYIKNQYKSFEEKSICFLLGEESFVNCHRSLIAEKFRKIFKAEIVNL